MEELKNTIGYIKIEMTPFQIWFIDVILGAGISIHNTGVVNELRFRHSLLKMRQLSSPISEHLKDSIFY